MNRRILRLAIPNIISNLTVPLLSSVDTALMGHMDQVAYLGAIAVGGMIFNFIYWGFGFLRMGTTGLTAQACGSQDMARSMLVLARASLVALFFAMLLILFHKPILEFSFHLVDASADVEQNARLYFNIRIFAAPATLLLYAFTGWFLGMQNARFPMILALVTNIFNIGFNLFFIKIMDMHVDGVAWGTVAANYLGVATAVVLFYKKYGSGLIRFRFKEIIDWPELTRFFAVNRDIFIRTLALIFAFSFFTAKSAGSGELILAANAILINLWTIMSYGIDGFAFASESLIGLFYGAKDRPNLNKAVRYSFYWGTGLALVFTLVYALLPAQILGLFTDNQAVLDMAMTYMFWTVLAPLISSFCYIWDGIFIGATASVAMRNAMLLCIFVFYLPAYFLLRDAFDNHALWFALVLFMLVRGITLTLYYPRAVLARI